MVSIDWDNIDMEENGTAPLMGHTNSGDSVHISTSSPPITNNDVDHNHHITTAEDGPLLSVNVQKLTLTAEAREERKGGNTKNSAQLSDDWR